MPRKLIMCGDHPVLAFEYEPASGRACSSGEILDPARLPLEFTSHGKSALYARGSTNGGGPAPFPPPETVSAVCSNRSAPHRQANCSTGPTD